MQQEALENMLPKVISTARLAAIDIMKIYEQSNKIEVTIKPDSSPVTIADKLSNKIISQQLSLLTPNIPIISEEDEETSFAKRKNWEHCWLIDPLDGTKEFIAGTNEFTVNIALAHQGKILLGVVLAPVSNECFWAIDGHNAYWQPSENETAKIIRVKQSTCSGNLRMILSRRHTDEFTCEQLRQNYNFGNLIYCGSTLKICLVAKGDVDLYPRLGPTSEWDTAAGQCILEAAGGKLINLDGEKLTYNKNSLKNPPFLACANIMELESLLDTLKNLHHESSYKKSQ